MVPTRRADVSREARAAGAQMDGDALRSGRASAVHLDGRWSLQPIVVPTQMERMSLPPRFARRRSP